jgi:hypothetical protein
MEFQFQGRQYRVVGKLVREKEPGYLGYHEQKYNVLQVRLRNVFQILWHRSFWKDVEREVVPVHAWVSSACLGDTGGWESPLISKCRHTMDAQF